MNLAVRSFLLGILATLVVSIGVGAAVIYSGYAPVNADAKPPAIERRLAMTALHKAVDRLASQGAAPLPATDATLSEGAHLYASNCAVCHGTPDGKQSNIAAGLYQTPPQFAKHHVDDDQVGETYWKIRHGIRFTGMPQYGSTLNDHQIWAIALFLKICQIYRPCEKSMGNDGY